MGEALRFRGHMVPEPRDGSGSATGTGGADRLFAGILGTPIARVLAIVASQTAILTAILFYFGWARVRATYEYFGVDVSTLNFSVVDYILRSVSTAFPLLVAIGFLAVGATVLHDRLQPKLKDDVSAKRLERALTVAGTGLVAVGFILALVITGPGGSALPGPAAMTVGLTVLLYRVMLFYEEGSRAQLSVIIGALITLTLLWTVTSYADYIGVRVAKQLQAGLSTAANVTVYSSRNLSVAGPGVTESTVRLLDSAYRFRYSGLRLLVSSGGQYFLLPARWRQGNGAVIVLPVSPSGISMRVQFQARAP